MKKRAANVKLILPVVARAYSLNVNAYAPPEGISELINATCGLMPEGMRAAREDVAAFVLKRNRVMAQGVTALATGAAVLVAAVPIPFPDATLLAPTEIAEVNAIAKISGIGGADADLYAEGGPGDQYRSHHAERDHRGRHRCRDGGGIILHL